MKIAIVSPNRKAYSETFIKAQKELLPFDVSFYSEGDLPKFLNDSEIYDTLSLFEKLTIRVENRVSSNKLSFRERIFAKSLTKQRVKLVLAQYGPTGDKISKVCDYLKIPMIVHFHGYDSGVNAVLLEFDNYKKLFASSHSIIAVSKAMEKQLLRLGCPAKKLEQITYGPNASFLAIKPNYSEPHFVGLGRFTDKKAPYYTLLAFSKVLEIFPDAKLTIGGAGDLYFTCKNLVDFLKIGHAVSLPGILKPCEFKELLVKSIAFVQHSIISDIGDTEGTPVAVLEASAAGVAVISTKHAGIPDVVIDGATGLLVDEHDVEGMATAMIKLLENRDLAVRMGASGKERIKENFTMKQYIDKLSGVIREVVEE